MRVLNEMEIGSVNGGVCENMSVADCFSGSGGVIVTEVSTVYNAFAGWLNSKGGDLGIWIYNTTHGC